MTIRFAQGGLVSGSSLVSFNEEVKVILKVDVRGFTEALRRVGRQVHLFAPNCARRVRCRICNPRGNPPSSPWAANYQRRIHRRNRR